MFDLKRNPFRGYVYLNQLETVVDNNARNKEFILSCNYAIRLLKEIDKNLELLFAGFDKIINSNPHISDEIFEDCFWLSDRIVDIFRKLSNLFNKFTKRNSVTDLVQDAELNKKIKIIRDNQSHLDEKLLIDQLTSFLH